MLSDAKALDCRVRFCYADIFGYGSHRGVRCGAFWSYDYELHAAYCDHHDPAEGSGRIGFRVAQVPEPATLTILALGALTLIRRRR